MRDITKCNKSQYIDIHSSSGAPISLRICSLRLFCALAFVCNIYYWILNMDRYWLQLIILTLPSHFKEHYCLKFSNDKIKVTHFVLNVAPLKSSLKLKSWGDSCHWRDLMRQRRQGVNVACFAQLGAGDTLQTCSPLHSSYHRLYSEQLPAVTRRLQGSF